MGSEQAYAEGDAARDVAYDRARRAGAPILEARAIAEQYAADLKAHQEATAAAFARYKAEWVGQDVPADERPADGDAGADA